MNKNANLADVRRLIRATTKGQRKRRSLLLPTSPNLRFYFLKKNPPQNFITEIFMGNHGSVVALP